MMDDELGEGGASLEVIEWLDERGGDKSWSEVVLAEGRAMSYAGIDPTGDEALRDATNVAFEGILKGGSGGAGSLFLNRLGKKTDSRERPGETSGSDGDDPSGVIPSPASAPDIGTCMGAMAIVLFLRRKRAKELRRVMTGEGEGEGEGEGGALPWLGKVGVVGVEDRDPFIEVMWRVSIGDGGC